MRLLELEEENHEQVPSTVYVCTNFSVHHNYSHRFPSSKHNEQVTRWIVVLVFSVHCRVSTFRVSCIPSEKFCVRFRSLLGVLY